MKRLLVLAFFVSVSIVAFSQQKEEVSKKVPAKTEIKQVPKTTKNKAQVQKVQQQKKQIKQAQVKRRQTNMAAQRRKAIQRRKK